MELREFPRSCLWFLLTWMPREFLDESCFSQKGQEYVIEESLKCLDSRWQNTLCRLDAPNWQMTHMNIFLSVSFTMFETISSSLAASMSAIRIWLMKTFYMEEFYSGSVLISASRNSQILIAYKLVRGLCCSNSYMFYVSIVKLISRPGIARGCSTNTVSIRYPV